MSLCFFFFFLSFMVETNKMPQHLKYVTSQQYCENIIFHCRNYFKNSQILCKITSEQPGRCLKFFCLIIQEQQPCTECWKNTREGDWLHPDLRRDCCEDTKFLGDHVAASWPGPCIPPLYWKPNHYYSKWEMMHLMGCHDDPSQPAVA